FTTSGIKSLVRSFWKSRIDIEGFFVRVSLNKKTSDFLVSSDGQRRLQGRFLGLQVKITWATRFLKFSCKEADRFSLVYRKSFLLSQGFSVRVLLSSRILSTSLLLGFQVSGLLGFNRQKIYFKRVSRQVKVLEFFDCPCPRQGVEDLRDLLHKGAQGDREAEVFQVSNDDTAVAQRRLEDKQPEEKTNTDCLVKEQEKKYQTGWKIKTGNVLKRSTQQCMKSGVAKHLGVAGIQQQNGLVDETNVTFFAKVVLYKNMGFNKSKDYKKIFISSGVGTSSMQVLHGFEFEVEPLGDHTFQVEPQENIDQRAGLQEAGLKDDMDARSDVYVLSNGWRKCSDNSDDYYLEYTPGNVFGMKIFRDQSGNTLRVSQSRFYNGKLVQTLLEGHSILSLEGSLSGDCDVEKNGMLDKFDCGLQTYVQVFVDFYYVMGISITVMGRSITRYMFMIQGCAGSLKDNLQHMMALSTTEAEHMTFTKAWKKEIWLKGLLTESGYELSLVAGIATGALVKGSSRSEVLAQVKVVTYRY
ncbi:hypothetical protein Tco_0897963, partial [Tanacetum coccineum]